MMHCFLCLEAKEDTLDCIQIKSSTWEELKVEGIILKHLWSSIMIKPKSQWFCLMCWNQLQYFHNFYVCIENAQNTLENNFPISHENSTIQTEYKSKTEGEYNNHGTSLVSVSMNGALPTSINIVKVEVEFLSDNELEERYNSSRHETIHDNCDDTMNYTDPPAIDKELTSVDDTDYVKSEAHSPKFAEGDSTIQTEYESQKEGECKHNGTSLVSVSKKGAVPTNINMVKEEVELISDNELEQRYNSSLGEAIDDKCDDTMDYTDPPVIGEELTSDDDTDYVKSQTHSPKFPEGDSTIQTDYESQNEGEWKHNGTSLVSASMNGAVPTSINIMKEEVEFISDNELEQHYNSSLDGTVDDNCDDTMDYTDPPVIGDQVKSSAGDPIDIISTTYYYQSKLDPRFHDLLLRKHIPMKCSNCELTFGNFIELKNHSTEAHNKPSIIVCCGTEFDNRSLLVDHICCHINTKYFRCGVCPKVLTNRLEFRSHTRCHENERNTTCLICNITLRKQCYMDYHKLTHAKSEDKKIPCKKCGVFFVNEVQLARHMKTDYSIEMCKICGESLHTAKALQLHLNYHGSPMCCNTCGFMVSNKIQLNKHFMEKHTLKRGPYSHICQVCNQISASENGIRKHIRKNHTTGLQHKCVLCYKTFKSIDNLQIHLNTHADLEEKQALQPEDKNFASLEFNQCFANEVKLPMRCNTCDLMVSNRIQLNKHFMEKHILKKGPKSYICQVCNRVSASDKGIRNHIRNNHTTGLQHKCVFCYKTFKSIDNLQIHLNTHADLEEEQVHQPEDKNFACLECNQCFSSEFLLSAHVKRVHVDKQFKVCEEVLPDIKALERHTKRHDDLTASSEGGLKEHIKLKNNTKDDGTYSTNICPICNWVSKTAKALRRHILRNHRPRILHKCPRCNMPFKTKDILKKHMKYKIGCN